MAYNGKSIGEVRAFEELKVQERPNGADAFSDCLNYEKKQYEKQRRIHITNLSILYLTPHFANTMLSAVLFSLSNYPMFYTKSIYYFCPIYRYM